MKQAIIGTTTITAMIPIIEMAVILLVSIQCSLTVETVIMIAAIKLKIHIGHSLIKINERLKTANKYPVFLIPSLLFKK